VINVINVIKAELVALDPRSARPRRSTRIAVQFNPETLHVSYAAALADAAAASARTTLRLQLWFDVSDDPSGDVRELTARIIAFMSSRSRVRFTWGTFQFVGILETLDETLEFFSPDGRPLRANVALVLSSEEIQLCRVPLISVGTRSS
jgi:contractile injection system tube protein